MMKKIVRVGSRDSKLAVMQTEIVMDAIARSHPELQLELVTMKTTGDIILDKTLDKIGGKGLFVKELDRALMENQVDITVHSLKDMPAEINDDLPILAFYKRGNPYDALVLPEGLEEKDMDHKLPIGSSSARRNVQLEKLYPDYDTESVRGNVLTRLSKLDRGLYSGLILARAGLERLGLESRITKTFTHNEMIPAAGQGILAVQGRKGEDYSYLDLIDDPVTRREALAERAFIRELDGGCSAPVGAFAMDNGDEIEIFGIYKDTYTGKCVRGSIKGKSGQGTEKAVMLARRLKEEASNENR